MSANQIRVYDSTGQHVPTQESRQMVQRFVATGLTEDDIAYFFGCSPADILYHYEQELENGTRVVSAMVGSALLENALVNKDPHSQQFWLKHRAGWAAQSKVEVNMNATVEVTERQKVVSSVIDLMNSVIDPRRNDIKEKVAK